jgi:hypothetical protein
MTFPCRGLNRAWLLPTVLAIGLLAVGACSNSTAPTTPIVKSEPAEPVGPPFFTDVTAIAGIDARYDNGEEAKHLTILESLGGGVALLDYDGDGLLDVFIPGGGYFTGPDKKTIQGRPCKLFKNLGGFRFKDVSKEAGLEGSGVLGFYTHGAAVADYDNDGWPDLLVTGWGKLALLHNVPDGKGGRRFEDVTKKAGLPEGLWTTGAAWADFDGDGHVDFYVCQYVNWSFKNHPPCSYDGRVADLCPPKNFAGLPHKVFRNQGDGTFADVSKEALLRDAGDDASKGLGVIALDLNGDGKPDVYVANDTTDNFLYMNRSTPGKIRFEEIGMPAGAARDDVGVADGGMGLAAGDYDGCGRPSLWVTNYENELHALYHNECRDGRQLFRFRTHASGIAAIGQANVGWGTTFLDIDHHGWEDLFVVHGHAMRNPQGKAKRAQRPVLLRNQGGGKFKVATAQGGTYFQSDHEARGVAFGDLDNDGRIDAVISHLNEPVAVLRNESEVGGKHWLGIELAGRGHRDVVGAKLILEDGRLQTRYAQGGGSYLSSSDRRHAFGLGMADKVGRLTVVWPSGGQQHFEGLAVDRYWRLTEGEAAGRPATR